MMDTKDVPTKPHYWQKRQEMACGWCKGFIHEEWISGMQLYVHDEPPVTDHEVLPYRPSSSGRQWTSTRR